MCKTVTIDKSYHEYLIKQNHKLTALGVETLKELKKQREQTEKMIKALSVLIGGGKLIEGGKDNV